MNDDDTGGTTIVRILGEAHGLSSQSRRNSGIYRAIAIAKGKFSCRAAQRFANHRFLVADAPTIPMAGCDMTSACTCSYIKFADRRAGPRRASDMGIATFGIAFAEQRETPDRRSREA